MFVQSLVGQIKNLGFIWRAVGSHEVREQVQACICAVESSLQQCPEEMDPGFGDTLTRAWPWDLPGLGFLLLCASYFLRHPLI